jgi:hypothetical protein
MAALPPCLVIGTPRSRTAWLSAFLSTPERPFVHEPSVHWKGLGDLYGFLDGAGCASDSGLTLFWKEAVAHRPDTRLIVVRRDPVAVTASFLRIGFPAQQKMDLYQGVYRIWREAVVASAHHYAMTVPFNNMRRASICGAIYRQAHWTKAPRGYVGPWLGQNIQADMATQLAAAAANATGFPALLQARLHPVMEAA